MKGMLGPFERIPVRWRIAVTTAGLTFLILVVFALVLGNLVGDRMRNDFESELRDAALADEHGDKLRATLARYALLKEVA